MARFGKESRLPLRAMVGVLGGGARIKIAYHLVPKYSSILINGYVVFGGMQCSKPGPGRQRAFGKQLC